MPAPSPGTKPSRWAANGRLALVGASEWVGRTFIAAHDAGQEEGGNGGRAAVGAEGEGFDLLRDHLEAADAGPNLAADPCPVLLRQLETGLIDGHPGGGDADLAEARHALGFLEIHVVTRIEVLELRHRLDRQVGDVQEACDAKSRPALDQAVPEFDQVVPVRGKNSHAGYHHAMLRPLPIPSHAVMLRKAPILARIFAARRPLRGPPRRSLPPPGGPPRRARPGPRCRSRARPSAHVR